MKIVKITLLVIAILAIIIVSVMAFLGFFDKIQIIEKEAGGYLVVGSEFKGPYMDTYQTMNKVDSTLRNAGIECTKGFGIYYDDPKEVDPKDCRSFVGNIVENADSAILSKIIQLNLKVDSIPLKSSAVVEFRIKSNASYMIGPMKVYPAFNEYIKNKGVSPTLFVEVYDVPAKKTYYIMQLQ